jgi:hypothetical protein
MGRVADKRKGDRGTTSGSFIYLCEQIVPYFKDLIEGKEYSVTEISEG